MTGFAVLAMIGLVIFTAIAALAYQLSPHR
jgi:hypothetical protein